MSRSELLRAAPTTTWTGAASVLGPPGLSASQKAPAVQGPSCELLASCSEPLCIMNGQTEGRQRAGAQSPGIINRRRAAIYIQVMGGPRGRPRMPRHEILMRTPTRQCRAEGSSRLPLPPPPPASGYYLDDKGISALYCSACVVKKYLPVRASPKRGSLGCAQRETPK